jgi:1-phosphofructokinase
MVDFPPVITVTLNPAIDRVIAVDNFEAGAHQVGREVLRVPAGKGINVSRVLAAMGTPSVATGFLGEENRSVYAPLFAGGTIADEFLTLPGATRENFTITDHARNRDTHIRMEGLAADAAALAKLSEKLQRMILAAGHHQVASGPCPPLVIFSGSLPPGVSPADFAALVDICLSAGARAAVDTSGPALSAVAAKPLWLVKPNLEELPQLVLGSSMGSLPVRVPPLRDAGILPARDADILSARPAGSLPVRVSPVVPLFLAAREIAARIPNVILSAGAEGAYLFASGPTATALHAVAPVDPAQVRSTVGCGDALLGAYVAGLTKGLTARDAFLQAVAVASASALTPGPADFDPAVAKSLLVSIRMTEIG